MTESTDRIINHLMEWTGADRVAIEYQLDKLTGYDIPEEAAKRTIEELYSDDGSEIFDIRGVGSLRGHFLLQEGLDSIDSIANSSEEELLEVRYLGQKSVDIILENARKRADRHYSPKTGESASKAVEAKEEKSKRLAQVSIDTSPNVSGRKYPESFISHDQWILWKYEDGQKLPVAPWITGTERKVSAMESKNWTSFEEARKWAHMMPNVQGLGFAITHDDPFVFIDYDDVRSENGEITPRVRRHIERLKSYTTLSTSGTGVHVYAKGDLRKTPTAVKDDLGDGSIEIYDSSRFVAVTGKHLEGTPLKLRDAQRVIDALAEYFGKSPSSHVETSTAPSVESAEIAKMGETNEIEHIFEAIRQVSPGDIQLRSPRTEERPDGSISYDPTWANSESGTRLAALDDFWIYREGMIPLDALQVVSLEEGLISSVNDYPSGSNFWKGVEKLRERGAHIPIYNSEEAQETKSDEREAAELAARANTEKVREAFNGGNAVRTSVSSQKRSYLERTALELTEPLIDACKELHLPSKAAHQTAELYFEAFENDLIQGHAKEATLGASLRIVSIELNRPRPIDHIAEKLEVSKGSIAQKVQRLLSNKASLDQIETAEIQITPDEYVPYIGLRLGLDSKDPIIQRTVAKVQNREIDEGEGDQLSLAAAALYAVINTSERESFTQREIANYAGITPNTIRNHYRDFLDSESSS